VKQVPSPSSLDSSKEQGNTRADAVPSKQPAMKSEYYTNETPKAFGLSGFLIKV
jgi:hypothetical protein